MSWPEDAGCDGGQEGLFLPDQAETRLRRQGTAAGCGRFPRRYGSFRVQYGRLRWWRRSRSSRAACCRHVPISALIRPRRRRENAGFARHRADFPENCGSRPTTPDSLFRRRRRRIRSAGQGCFPGVHVCPRRLAENGSPGRGISGEPGCVRAGGRCAGPAAPERPKARFPCRAACLPRRRAAISIPAAGGSPA